MSARIRGEHDIRWERLRPATGRTDATGPRSPAVAATGNARPRDRSRRRPGLRWLVAFTVAICAVPAAATWSVTQTSSGQAQPRLPGTPRAWLDSYEAAAIDNPKRVCSELFAPGLAQTYANAANGSCHSYFARITSFSVVVRRILRDGATAVLELRQTLHPEDWAVVLDRRPGGWQAVDLLTGHPAR